MILAAAIIALVMLYLLFRYSLFLPKPSGIRVLMYHDLARDRRDFLTMDVEDFRRQLQWLREEGYRSVSLVDVLEHLEGRLARDRLPERPVLLTFDDGYRSNVEHALPILKAHDFRATLFVTSGYIEEREKQANEKYLSVRELRQWTDAGMELALHSHAHPNYRQISAEQVLEDLAQEERLLKEWSLPYQRTLAYPFGARPKQEPALADLKAAFARNEIRTAFRIGNRVQPFYREGLDPYELKRIDIRGDESFFEFKTKVRKGRTKLF